MKKQNKNCGTQRRSRISWAKRLVLSVLMAVLLLPPVTLFQGFAETITLPDGSTMYVDTVEDLSAQPVATEDFSGTWQEQGGDRYIYKLSQSGNQITGTYHYSDERYRGTWNGTVEGNVLNGFYQRSDGSGKDVIRHKSDGTYEMISYRSNGEEQYTVPIKRISSVPDQPAAPTADFTGIWQQTSDAEKIYELKQSGNQITGKYYKANGTYIGEIKGTSSGNTASFTWTRVDKDDGHEISGEIDMIAQGDGSYYMKVYRSGGSLQYETILKRLKAVPTPPASSQQSGQHSAAGDFMTGTWTFDSDTSYAPQGDMKAFVVQNGNTFSGTYNKNHFNEWQAGTISGTIEGNTVKGTMKFDSWYVKDGKYYEKGTWNFSFTWDPQKRTLRGSPSHVQMVKVSDQVESPRYSSIDSVRGGPSTQQSAVVSTSWSGTWEFDTNWGKTVYVEQEGNTLYGTYYHGDGSMKGTFVGTVEGNVFKGTWCQNNKGTPDGGMIWTINADGTSKVEWGSGTSYTGTTNKAKKISDTYPRDKIKRTQGTGTGTTAPPPTPTPPPAPTAPTMPSPGTFGPSPIPITGGEARGGTIAATIGPGISVYFPSTGAIGYRIYRSTSSSDLGISVTDFYITSTSFADVNVEPNTTYYYTLKEVLAEARPLQGVDEKLGRVLATWVVTTSGNVNEGFQGGGRMKHFITLRLDNPYMSVDGARSEVDPGRGTTPIVYRSRTMVPISAIVRAMGGNATWAGGVREVGLSANASTVQMWIDKKNLTVNGAAKTMDVAPIIQNTRTFVPIRFAAENLKCKVDWLNSTKEIVIVWEE